MTRAAMSAMGRFHASKLGKLKLRLQFSGWLQYLTSGVLVLMFSGLAALVWLVSSWLAWALMLVAAVIVAVTVFDLITVKLRWHPLEAVPVPPTGLDAFDLMRARRACHSFQRHKLEPAHLEAVQKDAVHFGAAEQQLGNKPIRFEYINAPLTVWPVVGCEEFLVAIAPKTYDRMAVIDIGRSLQKLVHRATAEGLATCWIGPGADQASVIAHLGARFDLAEDHVICVCAIGYRSFYKPFFLRLMGLAQHKRLPLEALFFSDATFNTPLDTSQPPYSRCFEMCQWVPSSFNSQTTRSVAGVDGRMDFYATTPSRYYAAVALGIWCANWELGAEALGLSGHFEVIPPADAKRSLPKYDISWRPNR